jgi:putative membrane protein
MLLVSITAALFGVMMPLVVPEGMPLTSHMIHHLVWMNVVAPIAAWRLHASGVLVVYGAHALTLATVLQIVILWTWHAPPLWQIAQSQRIFGNLMPISMLAAAVAFWLTIFGQTTMRRWRAVIALLFTGKLFCLLGALLIFAPRTLYAHAGGDITLIDQQIAGLIMVAVCPLTYVAAGVVLSACWLNELSQSQHQSRSHLIGRPSYSE